MKLVLVCASAAVLALACMSPVYAQAPAKSSPASDPAVDPALIAKLDQLYNQDLSGARSNKQATMVYSRKAAEIRQLVERLQRGDKVNPSEIDTALEPIGTW